MRERTPEDSNIRMMRSAYLLVVLFTGSLFSCAQGKHGIVNARGFLTEKIPGNIPVDAQGEPLHQGPDTLYTVYVEAKEEVSWDSAWMNGRRFAVETSRVTEFPVVAGTDKSTGKDISLTPGRRNQLWLLSLDQGLIFALPPGKLEKGSMLLRGRSVSGSFLHRIDSLKVVVTTTSM